MRRCFELIVLVATAGFLIATSQAAPPCATDKVSLRANTTCGPPANLAVTSTASCTVTATGADFGGLPTTGTINNSVSDAGLLSGFNLMGTTPDGGNVQTCQVKPSDAGFTIRCTPSCGETADGGPCEGACSGTLTPQ